MRTRKLAALGAAASIVLGTVFAATPAFAAAEVTSLPEGEVFVAGSAPTTFSGTADAEDVGGTVEVLIEDDQATQIASSEPVTIPEGGAWTVDLEYTQEPGQYFVAAVTRSADGVDSVRSASIGFQIIEAAAPTAITYPADGDQFGAYTAPSHVEGTATPDTTVTVEVTGAAPYSTTATADASGRWLATLNAESAPAAPGDYTVTATQDVPGAEPASISFTVAEATAAPMTIGFDGVDAFLTDVPPAALSGTGEPGAQISITLYVDDLFTFEEVSSQELEATVADDGTWSVAFTEPLQRGHLYATAGQYVDGSYINRDSADLTLAQPAEITSIEQGAEFEVATAPSGASGVFESWYVSEEFGEQYEYVLTAALSNGDEFPVTLNADGTWDVDFGGALPVGDYTLTVTPSFTDEFLAENSSLRVAEVSFSVVTPAPAGSTPGGDEQLAATGVDVTPLALGGAGLFALGAFLFLAARRTRTAGV